MIHTLYLPQYVQAFYWEGDITIGKNTINKTIEFKAYGGENGKGKQFILTKAALGQVWLEFEDPFDILDFYRTFDSGFPYLIGYVHIGKAVYRLYAVFDNWPDKYYSIANCVFYNPLQKFQFLDEQDTVVAEFEKDKYTIYDTLPETERRDLKCAIALILGFRHATSVLRDIDNTWDLSLFDRYVYPQ